MTGDARRSRFTIAAEVVAVIALVGIALLLALPLEEQVTFDTALIQGGPTTVTVDVDCGSPLRDGPEQVSTFGSWRDDPCRSVIGTRRVLLGGVGLVALAAMVVVVVSRREPAPPRTAPR